MVKRVAVPPAASAARVTTDAESRTPAGAARRSWLVRHPAEWRQIGIVSVYLALLASMYFIEACRNVLFFAGACYFGFLNSAICSRRVANSR